jgi:hypothetical protein
MQRNAITPGNRFIDRTGQRYGRLVVLERAENKHDKTAWLCRCDCGNQKVTTATHLAKGKCTSCGCARATGRGSRPAYRSSYAPGYAARRSVLRTYKRAAADRNLCWELSDDGFDRLTIGNCHYCGIGPSRVAIRSGNGSFLYNGIDRLDNAAGYTEGNVVSSCYMCNRAKMDLTVAEFLAWVDRLILHRLGSNQAAGSKR